jgi:hypothetical protein
MENPMRTNASITLLLLFTTVNAAFAAPTMQEIRREYDAGHYGPVITLISRALAVRGQEAEQNDRYDLLFLRGEALLRLRNAQHAQQAFEDAFHAAADRDKRAAAAAMAALIRRSPGLAYSSKRAPDAPKIDIIDAASRKKAMSVLHEDIRAAVGPRIAEAARAQTLAPIQALLPDLFELASLEIVLTGGIEQSEALFAQLGERARELITAELRLKRRYLEEANGFLYGLEISIGGNIRPRELSTEARKELQDLAVYINQIKDAAQRGRRLAQALGETGSSWESIIANADDLQDRIDLILTQGR